MELRHINNISDIIHGTIQISCIEKMIISTPQFNRLHKILQNSTLFLTFPCNGVKRFEHSVGTMHIAGEMLFHSICNANDETARAFLGDLFIEMEALFKDEKFCMNCDTFLKKADKTFNRDFWKKRNSIVLPKEALLSQYIPTVIWENGKVFDYIAIFEALRIAALLHDVGHLPYSHALEKALENIFFYLSNKAESEKNEREKKYLEIFNPFMSGSIAHQKIHERIGEEVTHSIIKSLTLEWRSTEMWKNEEDWPIYLIGFAAFVFAEKILGNANPFFRSLHNLIDGTFDADRLDFICRDTCAASIDKHIIDYEKLINSMRFFKEGDHYHSALSSKHVADVEGFMHKRWLINTKINYHHRAAKMYMFLIECVTELAIMNLSEEKQKEDGERYDYIIKSNISGIWETLYSLIDEYSPETFAYTLIQLDDGWLDSILKKEYFLAFTPPIAQHRGNPLADKLEELTANRKNYHSIMRTDQDFAICDSKIRDCFIADSRTQCTIGRAKNLRKRYQEELDLLKDSDKHTFKRGQLKAKIKKLEEVISILSSLKRENNSHQDIQSGQLEFNGFFYRKVLEVITLLGTEGHTYLELITNLKKGLKDYDIHIVDALIVIIPANIGFSGATIWFYANEKPFDLNSASGIKNKLKRDILDLPGFYVYLSMAKNHTPSTSSDAYANCIGKAVATSLYNGIEKGLDKAENEGLDLN